MRFSLLLLLASATILPAATRTWVGQGTNNRFSIASSWQPAGVPQDGDTLYIDAQYAASGVVENDLLNLDLDRLVLQRGTLTGNTLTVADQLAFEGASNATRDVQLLLKLRGPTTSRRSIRVNQFAKLSGGLRLDGRDVEFSFAADKEISITGEISGTGNVFCVGAVDNDPKYSYNAIKLDAPDLWSVDGKLTLDFIRFELHHPQPRMTGDIQVGMPGGRDGFLYPYEAIGTGNPILSYGGRIYANRDPELPHSQRGVDCMERVTQMNLKLAGPVMVRAGARADLESCTLQENPAITTEPGGITEIYGLDNDHPDPAEPLVFDGGGEVFAYGLDVTSDFEIGPGTTEVALDDMRLGSASPGTFRVKPGGVLEIPGTLNQTEIVRKISMEGGTLRTFGLLRLKFAGAVPLELTADSIIDCSGPDSILWIERNLSGPGMLGLEGDGTIRLVQGVAAVSTYTGGTRIGVAKFGDPDGRLRGMTWLGSPGSARNIDFEGDIPGDARILAQTRVSFDSSISVDAGTFTFEGSATVASPFTAERVEVLGNHSQAVIEGGLDVETVHVANANSRLTCQRRLAPPGRKVAKTGAGSLRLAGSGGGLSCDEVNVQQGIFELAKTLPNTSANDTLVIVRNGAVFTVSGVPQLHPGIDVEVDPGGIFSASGITGTAPESINKLGGGGQVVLPPAGLAVGGNDGTSTFSGVLSGSGGLFKSGSGQLLLSGISTHTGLTKVTSGSLRLDGRFDAAGIEVSGRGTLSGDGQTTAITVKSGGTLLRQANGAALRTGSAVFESGSTFRCDIGGTAAAPTAGQLTASGAVTLQSGVTLNLNGAISPQAGAVLRLIDKTSSGAISGSFSGLPQGSNVAWNASTCTISYSGGTGNDLTLTSVTAPGPPPNQPPVFPAPPAQVLLEGGALQLSLAASDPDPGQTLTYSIVSGAPSDLVLQPQTGQISWTAGERNGGSGFDIVLQVTDSGTPGLSTQATLRIDVTETNLAPTFRTPPSAAELTVAAGELLRFEVNAADADLPRQTLAYSFQGAVPPGMTIDSEGVVTWPTGEFDPAASPVVTVVVTDNGSPVRSASTTFQLTLAATSHDPLPRRATATVTAGGLLSISMATTDPDVPPQPIQYAAPLAPPTVPISIDAAGLVTWQTTEGTAPGNYGPFRFRASHPGGTAVELKLRVEVLAPNTKPRLRAVEAVALAPGESTSFLLRGSDADLPAQTLTYSLVGTLPPGISVDPASGLVSFTASPANNLQFFPITARVTDNGSPSKSAEREFRVYVRSGNVPQDIALTIEKRDPQPGFKLTFPLPANLIYEVQSSDDFIEWTIRETGVSGPGAETYIANPSVPRRFFRIHVP